MPAYVEAITDGAADDPTAAPADPNAAAGEAERPSWVVTGRSRASWVRGGDPRPELQTRYDRDLGGEPLRGARVQEDEIAFVIPERDRRSHAAGRLPVVRSRLPGFDGGRAAQGG
jgi:hypothetical protein